MKDAYYTWKIVKVRSIQEKIFKNRKKTVQSFRFSFEFTYLRFGFTAGYCNWVLSELEMIIGKVLCYLFKPITFSSNRAFLLHNKYIMNH